MLVGLSIRNVVLIERLDLSLEKGLVVLTGETGAGKSILLDALGLALGGRSEASLLRHGAETASVSASFDLPRNHHAFALLNEQDIEDQEDLLILRRTLGRDGRSKAFVNDQPVSVSFLRRLSQSLVEIQGQFEQHGLMDAKRHPQLLDAFAENGALLEDLSRAWQNWRNAQRDLKDLSARLSSAQAEEERLRHDLSELDALDPKPGEEDSLARERERLLHSEKLIEAVNEASALIADQQGAAQALSAAQRVLERVADKAGGALDPLLCALDRAVAEVNEAEAELSSAAADLDLDPRRLQEIDDRFFALKDLARKHGCNVDELAQLREELVGSLAEISGGEESLETLRQKTAKLREDYLAVGRRLSQKRREAALRLADAVNLELPPLKLEPAQFAIQITPLEEADWSERGLERCVFLVSTTPGTPAGPLGKVASGGELSRLLLALKVVLSEVSPIATVIFDEVDSGVGGATAAAVGERLARLASDLQVLVVTHSPQVAALGSHHLQVLKDEAPDKITTQVRRLAEDQRLEEIARMLSGAQITAEARAAAAKLMGKQ